MPSAEKRYFEEMIKNSINYLEFGSGGSTILAEKCVKNKVISVESDKEWYNLLKSNFNNNNSKVNLHLIDLNCEPNTWGHPSKSCPDTLKIQYSNIGKTIDISDIDLVLIDGRFRVACALNIHPLISTNTIVLFDDFHDRLELYGVVLNYYNVIKIIGRLYHLQKKEISIDKDIVSHYELIEA
jgi:hypothetical protein